MDTEQRKDVVSEFRAGLDAGDLDAASAGLRASVPLHERMGLKIVQQDGNAAALSMELTEDVRGPTAGTVHGGMLATLADVAAAVSVAQHYDSTTHIPVTTDMHVRYYRQPASGPITARARVVHGGRRLLSTECVVCDAEGRELARSTATYMLVPRTF